MTRLAKTFVAVEQNNCTALIPYIMAGDPAIGDTATMMHILAKHGADIIEVGFPFSDPTADGPSIQQAGRRSLEQGTTLQSVFTSCAAFRQDDDNTPLILMGYANPVMQYGYADFARSCVTSGIDGVIIVDLPYEEAHELADHLDDNTAFINLIAPTASDERIKMIAKKAKGMLYLVAIKGITGSASADGQQLRARIANVSAHCDVPVVTGFGIKDASHIAALRNDADGVVVGSALIDTLYNAHIHNEDVTDVAANFMDTLHDATTRQRSLFGKIKHALLS